MVVSVQATWVAFLNTCPPLRRMSNHTKGTRLRFEVFYQVRNHRWADRWDGHAGPVATHE